MEKIFSFLELELSSDGLRFFFNIKKCYERDLTLFRDFIIDYLNLQTDNVISTNDDLYKCFVKYYSQISLFQDEDEFLEQFARYAKYYIMLSYEYIKNDDFKHWISIINAYRGKVAYPFLMELLDDFENGRITKEDLNQMALMVVNLLRNSKLEESELRKEFAHLGLRVNKMLSSKDREGQIEKVS
ncbi:hypothetical protein IKA15_01845 [bacterium]|nr:hypothetical protein [bacterium]